MKRPNFASGDRRTFEPGNEFSRCRDRNRHSRDRRGKDEWNFSAREIAAYDVDADSVTIARENAVKMLSPIRSRFFDGSIDDDVGVYDFVCANVTLDVISPISVCCLKNLDACWCCQAFSPSKEQIVSQLDALKTKPPLVERDGEWISVVIER